MREGKLGFVALPTVGRISASNPIRGEKTVGKLAGRDKLTYAAGGPSRKTWQGKGDDGNQ